MPKTGCSPFGWVATGEADGGLGRRLLRRVRQGVALKERTRDPGRTSTQIGGSKSVRLRETPERDDQTLPPELPVGQLQGTTAQNTSFRIPAPGTGSHASRHTTFLEFKSPSPADCATVSRISGTTRVSIPISWKQSEQDRRRRFASTCNVKSTGMSGVAASSEPASPR